MANIEESGTGRKTNVDVNIVPFIDLMSVLVIFLLITAVWTQVSMIQLGSSIYGRKSDFNQEEPKKPYNIPLRVDVKPGMYRLLVGKQLTPIPKKGGEYNKAKLIAELKNVKELYPEKSDAVININDQLPYKELIHGMDALLESGFPEISIATAEVE